jgi:hypothetical protein
MGLASGGHCVLLVSTAVLFRWFFILRLQIASTLLFWLVQVMLPAALGGVGSQIMLAAQMHMAPCVV